MRVGERLGDRYEWTQMHHRHEQVEAGGQTKVDGRGKNEGGCTNE